jgi:hypothetical protein
MLMDSAAWSGAESKGPIPCSDVLRPEHVWSVALQLISVHQL